MTVSAFQIKLCNDIASLLENSNTNDVIIRVGEEKKEFRAHSTILCARSRYFQIGLSPEWSKKQNGQYIFEKPNVSPLTFEIILNGKIELNQHEGPEILKLLVAVDEFQLDDLSAHIQKYLIKEETEWIRKDPKQVLDIVFNQQACTSLRNFCLETIGEDPKLIFESNDFLSLDEPILKLDVLKWSRQDFADVGTTLQQLVPLIRWSQIDSRDFQQKIMPYKKVLPKPLMNSIIDHYLNSDIPIQSTMKARVLCTKVDSTIINSKIAAMVTSWIDNQSSNYYNERRNPYKFELLFRASIDGFSGNTFRQKCISKGATVVFAKLNSNEMIFGGYNPANWTNDSNYHNSTTTFLFSFSNSQNIGSAQIGRIKNNNYSYATYQGSSCGPTFGGGHDFVINGNNWSSNPNHTYPSVFNNIHGGILQDYEVFQVVKK
ncbi:5897_t:CDS:2 [Ambispora gerdemannii]|uniref:5897_t:CDS:1 n=1 Tax=Ambispora gerdemannii TaxID=144530 RepID=A0A9N8Z628_9GLOM|nr:5897_t:CDS:2 [Ambispora gerdemannii]